MSIIVLLESTLKRVFEGKTNPIQERKQYMFSAEAVPASILFCFGLLDKWYKLTPFHGVDMGSIPVQAMVWQLVKLTFEWSE